MKCLHPVYLKDQKILVPCNQCIQCKIQRSKDWSVRIMHEASYHLESVFITLTYNDDYLPKDGSLVKDEISKFVKAFRKREKDLKIKYYGCGEYGEKYQRPHYHIILFGVPESRFQVAGKIYNSKNRKWETAYTHKAWKKGIIHVGYVEPDSARYVTDYVQKTYSKKYAKEVYGKREQPYSRMSKGIGERYAQEHAEQIKKSLNITVGGKNMGLCKYYRRLLDIDGEEVYEMALKRKGDREDTKEEHELKRLLNRYNWDTQSKFDATPEPLQKIYDQRRINFEAQRKTFKNKEIDA